KEKEKNEEEIVLKVTIPKEKRGRVIGKNGTNIKAIRNIIGIIARRENKKVYIKIID
ncbi:KH domain-containing protein, partial [Candidatus Dojkabacteria bacterium]|nr:KH domain-containing protein [Candidatus Dojkabacteria bacterium]